MGAYKCGAKCKRIDVCWCLPILFSHSLACLHVHSPLLLIYLGSPFCLRHQFPRRLHNPLAVVVNLRAPCLSFLLPSSVCTPPSVPARLIPCWLRCIPGILASSPTFPQPFFKSSASSCPVPTVVPLSLDSRLWVLVASQRVMSPRFPPSLAPAPTAPL